MSKLLTVLLSLIIGAVLTAFIGVKALPGFMVKEIPSPIGFEETLVEIEKNAIKLDWKVAKSWKVNFQKNLNKSSKS